MDEKLRALERRVTYDDPYIKVEFWSEPDMIKGELHLRDVCSISKVGNLGIMVSRVYAISYGKMFTVLPELHWSYEDYKKLLERWKRIKRW